MTLNDKGVFIPLSFRFDAFMAELENRGETSERSRVQMFSPKLLSFGGILQPVTVNLP